MSVALVSAQTGQTARQPKATSTAVAQTQTVPQSPATKPKVPASAEEVATQRALLDQYCVTCHNARLKTANLLLDQLDLAHLSNQAEVAEKVIRKLRAGMMPPINMKRPDATTMNALIVWMENEIDRNAIA